MSTDPLLSAKYAWIPGKIGLTSLRRVSRSEKSKSALLSLNHHKFSPSDSQAILANISGHGGGVDAKNYTPFLGHC